MCIHGLRQSGRSSEGFTIPFILGCSFFSMEVLMGLSLMAVSCINIRKRDSVVLRCWQTRQSKGMEDSEVKRVVSIPPFLMMCSC